MVLIILKFVLIINRKHKSYFKEINKHKVTFSKENKPLGTVGGIKKIKFSDNKDIIITNCDGIFDINFEALLEYHMTSKAKLLVASRKIVKILMVYVKQKNLKNI